MADYILSCCSTADLAKEHFISRDIHFVCFHLKLNDVDYLDDLGCTIPFPEFYKRITSGESSSTSQVNVSEYCEYFEKFLSEGKDILHLTLSSGLSGTYNSAVNAANILKEEYPDRKIYIVDSLGASSGYGLLMDKLCDLRDEGLSIDEVRDFAEENRLKLNHWFFSTDLSFYIKGGRISKSAGAIGTVLGICPLLNVDYEGHLIPREKYRPKKRVIEEIVKHMEEYANDGINYSGKCYICHSNCYDDARMVADKIEEKFNNLNGKVEINYIGTVIGSHTGPGSVGVFFWGKKRVD